MPWASRVQLDLGTVRSTLVFHKDGFCRREFLFSLLPWYHEMQFWETLSFAMFLLTQLLPGKTVRSNAEGLPVSSTGVAAFWVRAHIFRGKSTAGKLPLLVQINRSK